MATTNRRKPVNKKNEDEIVLAAQAALDRAQEKEVAKATEQAVETAKVEEAPKAEKKTKKAAKKKTEKVEKEPKVKTEDRRVAFMQAITIPAGIQFEDDKSAVRGLDSAMYSEVSNKKAIMFSKSATESNKAYRVLEVWLHNDHNDVCISKKLFEGLKEENVDLEDYEQYINPQAKSSKYVFQLKTDDDTVNFTNLFLAIV